MTGKIRNMGTVARELAANRRARSESEKTYGVFGVKKDGGRYAKPFTTHRTEAEAIRQADRMRSYEANAGHVYVIEAL